MLAFTILSFITVASAGNGYFYCKPGTCQTGSDTSGSIGSAPSDVRVLPAQSGVDFVRSGGAGGSKQFGASYDNVRPSAPLTGNYIGFKTGGGYNSPIGQSEDQNIDESVNRELYTISAKDNYADGEAAQRIAAPQKMKLRVAFIKPPEYNAASQFAKQAIQEKGHIYVLSRQPDVPELVTEVQMLSESFRQKPEVMFIKYRTPQDAVNAQQIIQQQYEVMGGLSRSINRGVAPLNYAAGKSGFANKGFVNKGFENGGFAKQATFGTRVTQAAPNQGQLFGEYFKPIQRIQYSRPQAIPAQQFNQQQLSYNALPGSSSFVNKGVGPAVSFSSAKAHPDNDQSNKQREETETFIYVLSKEPNIDEIVEKFRELTEAARLRPEVRFVKYKTPQEAIDAQKFIQQQYDALGGPSTSDI